MKQTKIDWCDCTLNPVVGCQRGCEYCYARKMNNRFKWIEDWSKPQFFPERLKAFESKTPKSVFINSMSDIADWTKEQIIKVFRAMIDNPRNRYIALTKNIIKWDNKLFDIVMYSKNMPIPAEDILLLDYIFFVGVTITNNKSIPDALINAHFINIEPIEEEIDCDRLRKYIMGDSGFFPTIPHPKTIIVGAETGNRKGKVTPQKHWIDKLIRLADELYIPIFMKESLRQLMGDDFRQDKLPWRR